ncbi:MAG TPA: hypothetical protein VFK13_02900 [Gemmatimonadaceae bacterium]|nr:hypothetical protein [Gemmatimonadaceae bacterium]
MTPPDIYRLLLQPLHEAGIGYMVTGAVAAIAYGEPRMTNDVDIVVSLGPGDAERLLSAFPASAYYVPPLDVLEEERKRSRFGHFNIMHLETALRADVYVAGDDPLHQWALQRRRSEPVAGGDVWFAPVEYVIVRKLEYYQLSGSDRHLRDVRGILRVSATSIDDRILHDLLRERGLLQTWELVRHD